MANNNINEEIEVKFYISDLEKITNQLKTLGAVLKKPRIFEINLRFDDENNILKQNKQVLRLRKDSEITMTYKGPAAINQPVSIREEIEFTLNDFDKAKKLLEALGFQVFMIYEKYRATYTYQKLTIVVDELPFGNFIEIEGPNAPAIHKLTEELDLDWHARIPTSYMYLFEIAKKNNPSIKTNNLTFAELSQFTFTPESIAVKPADR